ncbi:MAG: PTS sugar transporter subunit IIA [Peptostreptococcaceae bacterium]
MGIFDIFKKKNKEENKNQIVSPTNGEILELAQVPDEVFSQKMMGDGFAIKSSDGTIVSPVNGTIEMVFDTKHAVGLKNEDGLEILIHLGIDTVNLKGEGFEVFVKAGDTVKAGDKLIQMDVDFIQKNAKSDISPVIFTNLEDGKSVKIVTGKVEAKEAKRVEIV